MDDLPINQVICGDNREIMAQWPDECIDTIITSPPYWGMRNYGPEAMAIYGGDKNCEHEWGFEAHGGDIRYRGHNSIVSHQKNPEIWRQKGREGFFCIKCNAWRGQLGLEPDFNLYIEHLLEITAELKRILKPTGSFYLNMGDTYGSHRDWSYSDIPLKKQLGIASKQRTIKDYNKCLLNIPNRLRDRMVDEQRWTCVNAIIWHKRNPMPCSAKGRRTATYEYLFHFVKNVEPIFYINPITMKAAFKKPKNGIEGVDWEWRERMLKGKKKLIKFTLWQMVDYYFDLDVIRVPHKDIKDYMRHAPFNRRVRNAKRGYFGIIGVEANKEEMNKYNEKGKRKGLNVPGQAPHGIHRKRHSGYYGADGEYLVHPIGKNPGDVIEIPAVYEDWHTWLEILSEFVGADKAIEIFDSYLALSHPNLRDFWTINTQPFPETHFATFPMKLCEDPIKSSCPLEICKKCGLPRVQITKVIGKEITEAMRVAGCNKDGNYKGKDSKNYTKAKAQSPSDSKKRILESMGEIKTIAGWTDCGCNAGWRPGIMLDSFCGSGQALIMAKKLGRDYIGIDIVPEYCEMSKRGLENVKVSVSA